MPDKAVAEMERLRLLVEGVNNKIRVLQRRAYGYRDEEYLKLKIVAAFLPPLPRNANWSSTHTNPRRPVMRIVAKALVRTVSSGLAFGVQVHAPNPTVLNFRSDRFGTAQVLVAECLRLNADLLYAHRRAQRHDSRDWDPVQARGLEGGPDEREHHQRHGSSKIELQFGRR